MNDAFLTSYYHSPIGLIEIKSIDEKICSILFTETESEPSYHNSPAISNCIKQLKEYFSGNRLIFELPTIQDGTLFQKQVWDKLSEIPYGTTASYGQLAKQLGDIKNVRAVGTANSKNKLLIIVPCHRIIGATGSLTGYSGELWRKEWLLKHEIEHSEPVEGRLF